MAYHRWTHWWCLPTWAVLFCIVQPILSIQTIPGAIFTERRTIENIGEPYLVTNHIVIEPTGELWIRPGVELRFSPGIGITVRGILRAEGTEYQRIIMTRNVPGPDISRYPQTLRLIDGPSIVQGRLQLYYKGKWRSLCTNSRNWTEADLQVTCRQLGFRGGHFYKWFDRNNDSSQILYERPSCLRNAATLQDCDWNSKKVGSGVCDDHLDLGITCDPIPVNTDVSHWRGIYFEHTPFKKPPLLDDTLTVHESLSHLKYIDILYAGYNETGNLTSAIESIGVAPEMSYLNISFSAFNAINLTEPEANALVFHSNIENNRGYGVTVNSSNGLVLLRNCVVKRNGGDGVKYIHHGLLTDPKNTNDLCSSSDFGINQIYPVRVTALQFKKNLNAKSCAKKFLLKRIEGLRLTVNILFTMSERDNAGHIEIRDGSNVAPVLINFPVSNSSRPQSVTTTSDSVWIKFDAEANTNIVVTLEIVSWHGKAYDINVTDSFISENNGKGVLVENLRSLVHVLRTIVQHNSYGIHVLNGSGDVNITSSDISNNINDGINITYGGGRRNISYCSIKNNVGRGIAVWINETSTFLADIQSTVIAYSQILNNDAGIFVGNFCGNSIVNISGNDLSYSKRSAIEFLSCWKKGKGISNLLITNNKFSNNELVAVKINPAVNLIGEISYNSFTSHMFGALFIQNGDYEELEELPSNIEIYENYFLNNKGTFIASIGLSQFSADSLQSLDFHHNRLESNTVFEAFPFLNPRNTIAAVVTISSSNTRIFKNIFKNPESLYDLGCHVNDRYSVVNATYNWLGNKEGKINFNRIFDQKNRYNLAKIKFLPFLLIDSDPDTNYISIENENEIEILSLYNKEDGKIGGEVKGTIEVTSGQYIVNRDLYIHPNGILKLKGTVVLKFERSLGMMVQGELKLENNNNEQIVFTSSENKPPLSKDIPVRLAGNPTAGRVQVQINNKWGTVCNYGWTIMDAVIVCQQLGMILNPDDWLLEPSDMPSRGATDPILLSNVQCTELDIDITKCKAEQVEDFENSCTHENDVGLKCYPQSWIGVRFGVMAKQNYLHNVLIEKAGRYDSLNNDIQGALHIDFAHHHIENLNIKDNSHSGISITLNNMFIEEKNRLLHKSFISSNSGHGIVTRSQGLRIEECSILDNKGSGIQYNPTLTRKEQRQLIGWVDKFNVHFFNISKEVNFRRGEGNFFISTQQQKMDATISVNTDENNVLNVYVFGPLQNGSTEELYISHNRGSSLIWNISDLINFPVISLGSSIILKYNSGSRPLGNIVLYILAVEKTSEARTPTIEIINSKINGNKEGISVFHYNRYYNELKDRYLRVKNETIIVFHCSFAENKKHALLVTAPFRELNTSDLANITYIVNQTEFRGNGLGIALISRDIHNSNNIFHWIIGDNHYKENFGGGLDVTLPYVWQYNISKTHSFMAVNNSYFQNENFKYKIDGHFSKLNIFDNTFINNKCLQGLITIAGMEKEMYIERNTIKNNNCQYMVEFNMISHTDIEGVVHAQFKNNYVTANVYTPKTNEYNFYQPQSYVIALRGVQKINVTNNQLGNKLQYELLAGIQTSSYDNTVNVKENWWGTSITHEIRDRIFDFDDWNSYAIAEISPFMCSSYIGGRLCYETINNSFVDYNNLGGRLYNTTTLRKRLKPYVIKSDLTVMPEATLIIEPGVEMEFYPSVGILVLGTLRAIGRRNERISFTSISKLNGYKLANGRYRRQSNKKPSVRLCNNQYCSESPNEGFLEIYNTTTMQWVPLCDRRFTERNAEVVCQELGFQKLNVIIKFGVRLDIDPTYLSRVRTWPEPRQCNGHEKHYLDCDMRLNGYYQTIYSCSHLDEFVFIHCGSRNLPAMYDYWGGVRFAPRNFELTDIRSNLYTTVYKNTFLKQDSLLEYVDVIGAGILHNEKSAAIQTTFVTPKTIDFVNISSSASHGINIIAPTGPFYMNENRIENNLGIGINILVLNGDQTQSSFMPLKLAAMPYNAFGLVDICESHKILEIEERILLYYKYHNNPVDCIKIFKSVNQVKSLAFRLLHFNLFNSSNEAVNPDSLRIFDGDVYDKSAKFLQEITATSPNKNVVLKSFNKTLSIQLHATGATEDHGFIAEIVTLPYLAAGISRGLNHNITYSQITKNRMGGIVYRSTGEANPSVSVLFNYLKSNGIEMFGNFTSCDAAFILDVRNTDQFLFQNNLLMKNQGGLSIQAESYSTAAALRALIANNLFTENKNRNAVKFIKVEGAALHAAEISRNHLTRNYARYQDNIYFDLVKVNFSYNYVYNNTGLHTMAMYGFEQLRRPTFQTTFHNYFHMNLARTPEYSGTILAGGSGQSYEENILMNPINDFEIVAINKSSLDVTENRIDATNNWWGYNMSIAISGRIRDHLDDKNLLEVVYEPFYVNNATLLSGKCPPGWFGLGSTCFIYVGGIMTHEEAKTYCTAENASMPYLKESNENELRSFIAQQQANYDPRQHVWILSIEFSPKECITFTGYEVYRMPCEERLPFLCEKDPDVFLTVPFTDALTIAALSATGGAILLVTMCIVFWVCKSMQRQKERLERRNSIRASRRSNRSIGSASFSDINLNNRIISENNTKPLKIVETYRGSDDSIEKAPSKFDSSSFFNSSIEDNQSYEICEATNHKVEYTDFDEKFEIESGPTPIPNITKLNPTFDFGYDNRGFLDNSISKDDYQNWGSSCSAASTAESAGDVKRYLETSLDTNGKDDTFTSRSTPSSFTQELTLQRQLLETDI